MEKNEFEQIIITVLGWRKQGKIFYKVVEKYKTDYMEEFSKNLDDVEKVRDVTYKLIIALAIILSKSKLKGMSPVKYRIHSLQVA